MTNWQKKRRVMRRYDLTADMYDVRYAEEQTAKIVAALKNLDQSKGPILDVGCGTGLLFNFLTGKSGSVVGVDISKRTLMQALHRIKQLKNRNVSLIQADMDNLPFESGMFGTVFAVTVLQNSPDKARTLAEIRRIGKKEAFSVITGLKSIFRKTAFRRLLRDVRLNVIAFEERDLKCYVAICTS